MMDTKVQKTLAQLEALRYAYYYAKGFINQYKVQGNKSVKVNKLKPSKPIEDYCTQIYSYHQSLIEKGVPSHTLPAYEQFKLL